ncbi:putative autotransporter adhesin-like protein [Gillisia mitskevichiae]|uniref:Putative autotransporter adhesin-like protein n=1 Tax=Gillisia mitskevichiae TaxID=270921 RepID=A0A495NZZ6_9FLAO|nr:head GIN domain-containing protein [Gillisia mitskevichiae]RKS42722.1 putative autotransporter adhesin-like protein [Gillisia mitskevichiae]
MKKVIILLFLILIGTTNMNAQWWGSKKINGNGNMVSDTRSTPRYDEIALIGSMDVQIISGTEGKLKVDAESNLQEYILTEVKDGKLKISVEKDVSLNPSRNMTIRVTVPVETISSLSVTGSGDVSNNGILKANELKIGVTGSGDINLNVEAKQLWGSITGSGDIKLNGKAKDFSCKVTGSGDFMAYNLNAINVEAAVSGSGDIQVYASESLKARVSGSGDIGYKGNPEKQDFKTSGSGDISKH